MTSVKKVLVGISMLSIGLGVFFADTQADASMVRGGDEYTLGKDAVVDGDIYLLGKEITLVGSTTGDALVGAMTGEFLGDVGGDVLFVAGRTAVIRSDVRGDVRGIAEKVFLEGSTTEDVVVAGGTVIVAKSAHISGDVLIYADTVKVEGVIRGATTIHASTVILTGVMEGPVQIEAKSSLAVTGEASIVGPFMYRAPREMLLSTTAVMPEHITYTPIEMFDGDMSTPWYGTIFQFIVSVGAALFLVLLFPNLTNRVLRVIVDNKNGSLAVKGALLMLAIPLFSIVLIVTLVGFMPGVLLLLLFGAFVTYASMFMPVLFGALLAQVCKKEDGTHWAWATLGAMALVGISMLPLLGILVRVLLFCMIFGAVCVMGAQVCWDHRSLLLRTRIKPEKDQSISNDITSHEQQKEDDTDAKHTDGGTPRQEI